ncbi:hypothetical protein BU24DRAFT_46883 [Aaosphaeria arxii CBS 175.79]|uniref:Uncharacterized protein n=1 Tax=Aaosphaeria arxii CBS 175.79 TaxID=1450172 RepID=A0A6A5XDF1_9PLEO|nr:uncharacterized protein BU24DRAFT_46883 [Aaosphaeria arxii CBS 175.79]KAF2010836.1 hypothetical protein BU24DRAFT_46883 [Aaosphaeria arxii CBS 175.79]
MPIAWLWLARSEAASSTAHFPSRFYLSDSSRSYLGWSLVLSTVAAKLSGIQPTSTAASLNMIQHGVTCSTCSIAKRIEQVKQKDAHSAQPLMASSTSSKD